MSAHDMSLPLDPATHDDDGHARRDHPRHTRSWPDAATDNAAPDDQRPPGHEDPLEVDALHRLVIDHPFLAILGAVSTGFLLGRLLR